MPSKIFTDTSAFLAVINKNDQFHKPAVTFLKTKPSLTTSSWVIEEFIAHLHARYGYRPTLKGVELIQSIPGLKIEFLDSKLINRTFTLFKKYGSKRVSIVDTSNVALMNYLDLSTTFAFDARFNTIFNLKVVP